MQEKVVSKKIPPGKVLSLTARAHLSGSLKGFFRAPYSVGAQSWEGSLGLQLNSA